MTFIGPSTVPTCVFQQTGWGSVNPASVLSQNNQIMLAYKLSYIEITTTNTDRISVLTHWDIIWTISYRTNLPVPTYVVEASLILQ